MHSSGVRASNKLAGSLEGLRDCVVQLKRTLSTIVKSSPAAPCVVTSRRLLNAGSMWYVPRPTHLPAG